MTIDSLLIGTKREKRYYIRDDKGGCIAYFDSLEIAGAVMRYLKGAPMAKEDNRKAVEALQNFDAQKAEMTVKNGKNRKGVQLEREAAKGAASPIDVPDTGRSGSGGGCNIKDASQLS